MRRPLVLGFMLAAASAGLSFVSAAAAVPPPPLPPPPVATTPAPPPPATTAGPGAAGVLVIPPPSSPSVATPPPGPPPPWQGQGQPSAQPPGPGPGYAPPPYEPPLPPRVVRVAVPDDPSKTRAPEQALWLGARLGWDLPLGAAFRDAADASRAESSFVSSGPLAQLDVGGRFARRYVPFVFFAHTAGGAGSATTSPGATDRAGLAQEPTTGLPGQVSSARSELVGLGMRYLFSPDDWGAALEISYGFRFTRATFADGSVYRADAPGLLRLAAGLDVRTGRLFSWSPMIVATIGSYSDVTIQRTGQTERNVLTEGMTHAYLGAVVGGSFDLLSRWE